MRYVEATNNLFIMIAILIKSMTDRLHFILRNLHHTEIYICMYIHYLYVYICLHKNKYLFLKDKKLNLTCSMYEFQLLFPFAMNEVISFSNVN